MNSSSSEATLMVAPSLDDVANILNSTLVQKCQEAIQARGIFTVALSGGSLPSFLSTINDTFARLGVDAKFNCWHILLADERCVPNSDPENNMQSIRDQFLSKVAIPESQIHAIDETLLNQSTSVVASAYELVVKQVSQLSGGLIDCAVLGFGPDGHTCSLFPDHALLMEQSKWVASIEDSPKPPSKRITLTLPVLTKHTRHVIVCGAGESKRDVLKQVFASLVQVPVDKDDQMYATVRVYRARLVEPARYPCAMAVPNTALMEPTMLNTLTWIVDTNAMNDTYAHDNSL